MNVAALYVDPKGPYPGLVTHWFDEQRDARTYQGPWPVVAHPPCGPWSSLKHLYKGGGKELADHALKAVRTYGGVLEHPRGSKFWEYANLPKPGQLPDAFGGITFEVQQCDWGHVARKRTWLYVVGITPEDIPPAPAKREPTHWVSGVQTEGARGKPPPGIKICSSEQRRRTPIAFAEWLIAIAAKCQRIVRLAG
jgi:hypothetical protein